VRVTDSADCASEVGIALTVKNQTTTGGHRGIGRRRIGTEREIKTATIILIQCRQVATQLQQKNINMIKLALVVGNATRACEVDVPRRVRRNSGKGGTS